MSIIPFWAQTVLFTLGAVGILILIFKILKSKIGDNLKTVATAILIPPFICLMVIPYIPSTLDASQAGLFIDGLLGISIFSLVLGRVIYDKELDVAKSSLFLVAGSIGVLLISLAIGLIEGNFISNILWITEVSKQITLTLPFTAAIVSILLVIKPTEYMKKTAFLLMSFPGSLYLSVGFRHLASSILLNSISPFITSTGFSYSMLGGISLALVGLSTFVEKESFSRILGGASTSINAAQIILMLI